MSAAHEFEDDDFRPIGLGHNSGKNLREILQETYGANLQRAADLLTAIDRVPEITSDDMLGKVGDLVKQISAAIKDLDGARVKEKEPFLAAGRDVDGLFKGFTDRLEKAKANLGKDIKVFLDEKAARERALREAEERRRAEEARAREEERRKAEQARREAEDRARRAEQEKIEAEARAKREAAEREERHRREMAAAEARAREEETKRRQSDENREKAQAEAARLRKDAEERAERETREAEARAKRDAEEADRRAEEARRDAARLADEEDQRRRTADEAEAQRIKAEKEATARPADMARTRSDLGSVSTLRRKWEFHIEDESLVDWNQLRHYIPADAKEKMIRSAIRSGVRPGSDGVQPLAGIRIYETSEAAVR